MSRPEGNPSHQEYFHTTYNNLERVNVVRPRDDNSTYSTAPGAHNPSTAARCPNRVYISMHPIDLLEAFGWGDAERLAAPALYVALLEAVVDGHMLGSGPYAAYLQTGAAPARPGGAPNPPEFEVAIVNALLMNMAEESEEDGYDGDEDDGDDAVFDADDEDDGGLVDDDEDKMGLEGEAEAEAEADGAGQAQVRSVKRKERTEAEEGGRAGRKRTRTRYDLEAAAEPDQADQSAAHAATDAAPSSSLKRKWDAVEGAASSGSAHRRGPRAEARWVGQTTVFAPPMRLPRRTLQLFSVYMPDTEEF